MAEDLRLFFHASTVPPLDNGDPSKFSSHILATSGAASDLGLETQLLTNLLQTESHILLS